MNPLETFEHGPHIHQASKENDRDHNRSSSASKKINLNVSKFIDQNMLN